jgi:hypothetical protein
MAALTGSESFMDITGATTFKRLFTGNLDMD